MRNVDILRKKYPRFVYDGYSYRITNANLELFFDFNVEPKIKFQPKIVIKNIDKNRFNKIGESALNNFIFHLGLMEIPSYWKATCSPTIEIRAGYLDKEQTAFWKDFIFKGMGQFFYENKINFKKPRFLKIEPSKIRVGSQDARDARAKNSAIAEFLALSQKKLPEKEFLIPMGEGKDSIVALELLKNASRKFENINCFVVNPTERHFKILKIAGVKNPVLAERKMDSTLLKLNQRGYLNGHTPITALISNLAVFCAVLFGYNNVAMSCEKSADEGNIKYLGKIINHQWSKGLEFERKFRNYVGKYLTKEINYFSLLRPLYEIQIAKIFSGFPKYLSVFLSCNEARKTKSGRKKPSGKWCGKCPKCLFVWTILYPFIEEKKLLKIFGKNLFEKKELLVTMKNLIGEKEIKPFECVGTKRESLIAFYLSWKKIKNLTFSAGAKKVKLPVLLRYFEKEILPKHPEVKNKKG